MKPFKPQYLVALGVVLLVGAVVVRFAASGSNQDVRADADPTPLLASEPGSSGGDGPVVTVYKSPTCGCCTLWGEHLREAGFTVETVDVRDLASVKAARGVGGHLASCHTADVEGYVIEGHVPAADIRRLLAERPDVKGLAVPGMPGGSPGMESAPAEEYDVLAFDEEGATRVWASH